MFCDGFVMVLIWFCGVLRWFWGGFGMYPVGIPMIHPHDFEIMGFGNHGWVGVSSWVLGNHGFENAIMGLKNHGLKKNKTHDLKSWVLKQSWV